MKISLSILIALAGAILGFFSARSGEVVPHREEVTAPRAIKTKTKAAVPKEAAGTPRTLAGLADTMRRSGGLPDGVLEDLGRMSSEALREQLLAMAAMEVPTPSYLAPAVKWRAALEALAAELFHREGEAAIIWAESTGDINLGVAFLSVAASKDPQLVKQWMPKFSLKWDYQRQAVWRIFSRLFDSAASRGSDALLEVETLFPSSTPESSICYAPDFDFAGYVEKTQDDTGRRLAMRNWAARDPDGVSAMLAARARTAGPYPLEGVASGAMEGVALAGDDASVVRWLESWTAGLSEGARQNVLVGLLGQGGTRQNLNLTLVTGLSSAMDRTAVAASAFRLGWNGGSVAPYLRALPSSAERQGAVALWWSHLSPGMRDSQRTMMEKTVDQIDLPPAEAEAIKAVMSGG
jgi:hypothetical protein